MIFMSKLPLQCGMQERWRPGMILKSIPTDCSWPETLSGNRIGDPLHSEDLPADRPAVAVQDNCAVDWPGFRIDASSNPGRRRSRQAATNSRPDERWGRSLELPLAARAEEESDEVEFAATGEGIEPRGKFWASIALENRVDSIPRSNLSGLGWNDDAILTKWTR
ncbi:hypothetical protein CCHR01_05292 [Colletotrichum chrysophilum]|uniref:Uncharacterized protein n=1 Tax=Colletotrichum chrysophilum TaxID=1836956 RepID=A0AAD9ARY3_9PEZI|nr:hypothetical protein CCHR01_05292 [Colletotrichum chrysophilum]